MSLTALAAGLGSASSGIFNYFGQRSANRTNIRLARSGQAYDREMWELQNEYNTPRNQMQRFSEAGLNPNLMYGQSSAGNATDAPKAHVPSVQNTLGNVELPNVIGILNQYNDHLLKKQQLKNMEKEYGWIDYARSATYGLTEAKRQGQDYQNWVKDQTRHGEVKDAANRFNINHQRSQQETMTTEMQRSLKPYSLSMSDALWTRIIAKLWQDYGRQNIGKIKQSFNK